MDFLKTTVALLALATSPAFAKAADWHWNEYGASSYSGQVALRDDQGSSVTYQRYSAGSTPALFGAVSVQSPLMVVAGNDINFDIVYSGQAVNKPTCNAPETPRVFVSPVTVCNFGQGNAIAGINAWADQNATQYIPRLAVWIQGYNWRTLDWTECGRVEVKTFCK